jgi:hypothetical protein
VEGKGPELVAEEDLDSTQGQDSPNLVSVYSHLFRSEPRVLELPLNAGLRQHEERRGLRRAEEGFIPESTRAVSFKRLVGATASHEERPVQ